MRQDHRRLEAVAASEAHVKDRQDARYGMISLRPGFYDPDTHLLTGPLGQRHLTPTMHRILTMLAEANGRAVNYGCLIEHLWPVPADQPDTADSVVKVQVSVMRRYMREVGLDRRTIGTRHHIGYFLAPMPAAPAI